VNKAVRRAIRATGAKLFLLPKYSPDLNPIEMLFAKLKYWSRCASTVARFTPEVPAGTSIKAPYLLFIVPRHCCVSGLGQIAVAELAGPAQTSTFAAAKQSGGDASAASRQSSSRFRSRSR
jgi:DDE superfamily endonuclease